MFEHGLARLRLRLRSGAIAFGDRLTTAGGKQGASKKSADAICCAAP
jgi:hypothetical protein